MLAFESYSKTSFEIIIKERLRAYLFKKMALQVPRFILEGKLKQGDRSTFEKFIDDEKWLGECIQQGVKGSKEWEKRQDLIKEWHEAANDLAKQKNLIEDYRRLYDFYNHISEAFKWAMKTPSNSKNVARAREELSKIKKPKEGAANAAYIEMKKINPANKLVLNKCTPLAGTKEVTHQIGKMSSKQPSKNATVQGARPLIAGAEDPAYRKDLSFWTDCQTAKVSSYVPGTSASAWVKKIAEGAAKGLAGDPAAITGMKEVGKGTAKGLISLKQHIDTGGKHWKNKIHEPLFFGDTSFTAAAAAGKHWNASWPYDSFDPAANYSGNDFMDYPGKKCKPWNVDGKKTACQPGWDACNSPACKLYKEMGAGTASLGWGDPDGTAFGVVLPDTAAAAVEKAYKLVQEIIGDNCIWTWWFLYQPMHDNPSPDVDKGGVKGITGDPKWAKQLSLYANLAGDYKDWDSNSFASDSQSQHQYELLQYAVQKEMVKCRYAYINTISQKYNKKKEEYEKLHDKVVKLAKELGLDMTTFMGALSSNAVQGIAYDVCKLYIFAAFILATNFMSGTDCPTDFDYSAADIKKIGMAKLREMFVDVFQDMVEKIMQTYSGANIAGVMKIDQLQKATNYNHEEFKNAVTKAFDEDSAIAAAGGSSLMGLSNLDAVGSANHAYMEEELSDYAYILDANLYQIVKPIK